MEAHNSYADFGGSAVWAIVLDGSFPTVCGTPTMGPPQTHTCPPNTTELVLIDAHTGSFLEAMSP